MKKPPAPKKQKTPRGGRVHRRAGTPDEVRRMLADLGPLPDDPAFHINVYGIEQRLRWIEEEERALIHDPQYPAIIFAWMAAANSFLDEIRRMLDVPLKRRAGATPRKRATRVEAAIKAMVDDLQSRQIPRAWWVHRIARRLKKKRLTITDRQIQNVLTKLGFPSREKRN